MPGNSPQQIPEVPLTSGHTDDGPFCRIPRPPHIATSLSVTHETLDSMTPWRSVANLRDLLTGT